MKRCVAGLAAGLSAAARLGCAGAPEEPRPPTVLVGSAAAVVVILPLNVTAVMPSELEAASPLVWQELHAYLKEQGSDLKTLAYPTARNLWLSSIREARAGAEGVKSGFDEAARIFIGKLAKHAEFDTVIFPSLFIQSAEIEGRTARWDQVERTLELEPGRWNDSLPEDFEFIGRAAAGSLHAVVFDAKGSKLQEAQGGLDLLVRVNVLKKPGAYDDDKIFRFTPHPHPLENRDHLREGIARALAPFLPALLPERETAAPESE